MMERIDTRGQVGLRIGTMAWLVVLAVCAFSVISLASEWIHSALFPGSKFMTCTHHGECVATGPGLVSLFLSLVVVVGGVYLTNRELRSRGGGGGE